MLRNTDDSNFVVFFFKINIMLYNVSLENNTASNYFIIIIIVI